MRLKMSTLYMLIISVFSRLCIMQKRSFPWFYGTWVNTKHGARVITRGQVRRPRKHAELYISKTMIWCAIAEHVMKDWSCERLVLVASKRF